MHNTRHAKDISEHNITSYELDLIATSEPEFYEQYHSYSVRFVGLRFRLECNIVKLHTFVAFKFSMRCLPIATAMQIANEVVLRAAYDAVIQERDSLLRRNTI